MSTIFNRVSQAIHTSTKEVTHHMTAHVQAEATAHGWPSHVVNSMHVSHDKDGFSVNTHSAHHAEALNLEYGTPTQQPTAAVRKFLNNHSESEAFFMGRLSTHLGDL